MVATTTASILGNCLSFRQQNHRIALIAILVLLDALWSLKQSLSLIIPQQQQQSELDAILVAAIGNGYNSSWLYSFSASAQETIAMMSSTSSNTSSTSIETSSDRARRSDSESSKNSGNSIKIDIISIGSIHRPEYQTVQQETFGSHETVRNFFKFNEYNDDNFDEPTCHTNLTMAQVYKISNFCQFKAPHNKVWRMRRRFARFEWLEKKANAPGWMCAQKRLPSSLAHVLKSYQQQQQASLSTKTTTNDVLPSYLIVMDDDTYLNMNHVIPTLPREYPSHAAHVVAGCLVQERIHEVNFTFPFGGWSTMFSTSAIQNFIRPIHCNSNNNSDIAADENQEFVSAACTRLSENLIGERDLFQDGMSVAHLMDAYINRYKYLDIDNWDWWDLNRGTGGGSCLHSDWAVGYFVQFYNIASRHANADYNPKFPHRLLQGYLSSTMYTGKQTAAVRARYKECNHDSNEKCTASAHICHYVTPDRMRTLYDQTAANTQQQEHGA